MKNNKKLILFVSLFSLIGIPLLFLIISLITEEWRFFIYSIVPALVAGMIGLFMIKANKEKS